MDEIRIVALFDCAIVKDGIYADLLLIYAEAERGLKFANVAFHSSKL